MSWVVSRVPSYGVVVRLPKLCNSACLSAPPADRFSHMCAPLPPPPLQDLVMFLELPVADSGVRFLQLSPGEFFFTTLKVRRNWP